MLKIAIIIWIVLGATLAGCGSPSFSQRLLSPIRR